MIARSVHKTDTNNIPKNRPQKLKPLPVNLSSTPATNGTRRKSMLDIKEVMQEEQQDTTFFATAQRPFYDS